MRDSVEIKKSLIPYDFDILLGGEIFNILVRYNSKGDLFTLDLSKDGELICVGEPIIYGVPLWQDVWVAGKYPNINIVAIDESGDMNAVTYENLSDTVLLVVMNDGGE